MTQIANSPLGLLSAGADHRVRVYQLGDRREMFTLFGHDDVVQALAVAPNGETFASGGADGVVCIWSLACGTWTQRFIASPMRR
jgi:WD40 repeat protein